MYEKFEDGFMDQLWTMHPASLIRKGILPKFKQDNDTTPNLIGKNATRHIASLL